MDETSSARQWTPESLFAVAGLMALAIRLVQGWIF